MEELFKGKFLSLKKKDNWEFAERIGCSSVVIIIPHTYDNEIILVEQKRVPLGRNVIEFPSGLVGDDAGGEGESFYTAAVRELKEETGYSPSDDSIKYSGSFCTSPGLTNEKVHLVRIEVKADEGATPEEGIIVHVVPLENLKDWLKKKSSECDISVKVFLYSFKCEECYCSCSEVTEEETITISEKDSFAKRVMVNFLNNLVGWTIAICISFSIGSCTIREIVNAWK